ncbi:hypothetical protein E4U46_000258, partial [Claviceps purpurea]
GSHHRSTRTPREPKHVTVDIASERNWQDGLGFARAGMHVFSVNNDVTRGYRGYKWTTKTKGRFTSDVIKSQLDEAKNNNLQE